MPSTKSAQKSSGTKASKVFSEEERAAMVDRAQEVKGRRGGRPDDRELEEAVVAKIAEMPPADRRLAERLHSFLKASAPSLTPRLWYGMPAYYKDGKLVCHFQAAQKFKTRYATLGFSDAANLDDGAFWPVAFALKAMTPTEEAKIAALLKKALA